MQRLLKVLVVEPNKMPYEKEIPNRLKDKQEIVGGLIEYTYLDNVEDICLIINEEGKLLYMEPNRLIDNDPIAGTFIVVGETESDGEDRSLTSEQIDKYKKMFGKRSINEMENYILAQTLLKQKNYEL